MKKLNNWLKIKLQNYLEINKLESVVYKGLRSRILLLEKRVNDIVEQFENQSQNTNAVVDSIYSNINSTQSDVFKLKDELEFVTRELNKINLKLYEKLKE